LGTYDRTETRAWRRVFRLWGFTAIPFCTAPFDEDGLSGGGLHRTPFGSYERSRAGRTVGEIE
jgi:hypothetical protein